MNQMTMSPILTSASTRARILVVDDDDDIVTLLKLSLERAGAQVVPATSGAQALRLAFEHRPDIVLLDINMPGMDGLTLCQRLRELSDVTIIMITALPGTDYVTGAFAAGADDYILKPFETSELLARVQACLRRASKTTDNEDSLILGEGDLVIDLRRHSIWVRQQDVHLTRTEFDLLMYLARNRGRVLTHSILNAAIWGEEYAVGRDSLKQFISALRKKIELDPHHPKWLVSEHGVGYTLLLD
jgi:two-component system, OmpR family, KDP operon response regulator KdpE